MSLPAIFTTLSGTSAVTALIGTSPVRCYPAGNIPQGASLDPSTYVPCVTWQTIAGTVENSFDNHAPADHQRIQIDCWDLTFSGADALHDAVRAALESIGYCVSLNGHDFDSETKRYRSSSDWTFWLLR